MKEFLTKNKNKLKDFISSFKKSNPHTHWNNLLYMFLVITIVLIIFSFYLLYEIKNQQVFQIKTSSVQINLMNEKLLNSVNESFNNKLIKEKEIQDGLDTYKDPSIN